MQSLGLRGNICCADTEGTGLIPYGSPDYWGYYPARPFAFAFCDTNGNTEYFRWEVDHRSRRIIPGPKHEQEILRQFTTDSDLTIVGHNLAYDMRMFQFLGYPFKGPQIQDTMILAHTVTCGDELTYALKPLAKKYLEYPDADEKELDMAVATARRVAKDKGYLVAGGKKELERGDNVVFAGNKPVKADYWLAPNKLLEKYATGDVERSMLLFRLWWPEVENDERTRRTYNREMQLFHVLRKMEARGTRVFPTHARYLKTWYMRHMAKQKKVADRCGGAGMNFNSPKQLIQKFYIERGYEPVYNDRGNPSLGKDQLSVIAGVDEDTGIPRDKLAKAILEFRAAKQSITAFLNVYEKFWYPVDEEQNVFVLHPNYNQCGAVTGRMSCCIAEGTPIEIARDVKKYPKGIPVEQVKPGDWAYCVDEKTGELHLRQVKKTWNRGMAHALVRVHWEGKLGKGKQRTGYVDVTPEHKLRTVDGRRIQAKDLKRGDQITAFHRGYLAGRGIVSVTHKRNEYESRFILSETEKPTNPKKFHAHHKDGNKLNNVPNNLEWKPAFKHWSDHSSGENNGRYIHWTKEKITEILEENEWSITRASHGYDYTCFRRHVARFYDLTSVKKMARMQRPRPNNPYYDRGVGGNHQVVRVEKLKVMRPVYDLWIDEHHNFFAGELTCFNSDPNLQQVVSATTGLRKADIVGRARECFGPKPNCLWYLPDFGQMEIYVFAFMANEKKMQEALLSGHDFHSHIAEVSFGKNRDYQARKKYYRKQAKLIMFGKLYGGGVGTEAKPGRLVKNLQMPYHEGVAFVQQFDKDFIEVSRYMKRVVSEVKRSGEAYNAYGRRYKLGHDWAYKAVNYLIQGTCADVLKMATLRVDWLLNLPRWKHPLLGLLNTVHDELIIEVPYELHSRQLMREIVYVMQVDSAMLGLPVPLPVGIKIAKHNWSETKDVELEPWVRGGIPRDDAKIEQFALVSRDLQSCPYQS